jgi:hypothetical protein
LVEPGGSAANSTEIVESDIIEINVEPIVWPFSHPQLANWQNRPTSQWNGVSLADAWYINKALEDYIADPEDQGSMETIHPDTQIDDKPAASAEGPLSWTTGPSTIGGTYPDGFVMEFDYSFETSRNPQWGYVQAAGHPKKLSFVGNSGIKFGVLEYNDKPFEAAILDVDSVVGLGGSLGAFEYNPVTGTGINDDGEVAIRINPADPPTYVTEPLNRLMTGVRYGGDYEFMADNSWRLENPPRAPASAAEFYSTLVSNYNRPNDHMKIDVTRIDQSVYYGVDIYLDGEEEPCYSEYVRLKEAGIGALAVQSHWGSGVIFSNMSVIKKEP